MKESPDLLAMMRRMLRALARRAGEGDLEALEALHTLEGDVPMALAEAAGLAHDFGYSWSMIGTTLGMTRQGAHQRFGS